ncbi:MAG TPA: alpha-ribazole phosphatase family protein [Puia sp.]|nr:alpha-ribazole phosphatase family protein [Puia sp.]
MEIYLIRHTTPAVAKGTCYGQTDLDITDSFFDEAAIISKILPQSIQAVHSSPLQRCHRLAAHLFPSHSIVLHDELMEIHCGQWEMRKWDELPEEETGPLMKDFVNTRFPGGENYQELHERVNRRFELIRSGADDDAIVIVAHGGVIRSILSAISGTALIDSFSVFTLYYGCVVKITDKEDALQYEIISNIVPPGKKEQHKPSPR